MTPQDLVDLAASQQEPLTLDEARAMMGESNEWTLTDFRTLLSSESSSNAVLNRIREEEEDDDEESI